MKKWALSRNPVILGFFKHGYHARDSITSTYSLFGPAKGSSVWCADPVKSLGNSIVPKNGKFGYEVCPWFLWLYIILFIGTGMAIDVPFVFDETSSGVASYNSDQIEQAHISSPDLAGVPTVTQVADNDVLDFPITGGGNIPVGTIEKNVGDLKKTLDAAVEPDNPRVREEALVLALKYPGDLTIDQIASVYSYLKNGDGSKKGWGYVRDPRGLDYFNYANASLKAGDRANCVGGGDCDDFAILMAALVESVGGTTRIILARNDITGGHAYTEVYLGNLNVQNNQVEDIIIWLTYKFDTNKIYTHIDTDTKDVWLNLDWGPDEKGNTHPGGPFYQGDKHIVLCIRDRYEKTALKLSEPSESGEVKSTVRGTVEVQNGVKGFKEDPNGSVVAEKITRGDREYYRIISEPGANIY